MKPIQKMPSLFRLSWLCSALWLASAALFPAANVLAQTPLRLRERNTFYLMPTVEGLYACDEGMANPQLKDINEVNHYCTQHKLDGSAGISRLLDQLEPGGPKGQVQVGYLATLQLLSLYQRKGTLWVINEKKLDVYLQVLSRVRRPVVVYLAADHFDTQGPLVDELIKDPRNLLLLSNGKPAISDYFGYRIVPYTLQSDDTIAVNHYRYMALRHVAKRLNALPKAVRDRIIAVTLAGELHQMFPDFEGGMGKFEGIQVTDYGLASVAGFRRWLAQRYGSLQKFNAATGFSYPSFDLVQAPAKDIRKDRLQSFAEHYDAFADGQLPIAGWLWDPQHRIERLDLYIDGLPEGAVEQGYNRLDVYRVVEDVTSPNVGFRRDFDFSRSSPGRHLAQVVAQAPGGPYLVGQVQFIVVPRDQSPVKDARTSGLAKLKPLKDLGGVKASLDLPRSLQDVYFNPLARDWNQYRAWQVRRFMERFYQVAREAGLPADKLYSHQILPNVNSSWNPQLFAVEQTLTADTPWKIGMNLYGGATDSDWVRRFVAQRKITDYGVPEFNPQQWKRPGAHVDAMLSHYNGGARFISPYYFSTIPDRYKADVKHGVNAMELRADNPKDGSNQFYQAIRDFAKY